MFDSRLRRLVGGVALAAMLIWPASGAAMAAGSTCTMTVAPASGPPGTLFTFTGSGFTPVQFSLAQKDKATRILTVNLNGADPWTYAFVAGNTDTGRWKVTASAGGSGCQASSQIRVGLPSTSTTDPLAPADQTPAVAALAGMVLVFVVSAGLLFRRSRRLA